MGFGPSGFRVWALGSGLGLIIILVKGFGSGFRAYNNTCYGLWVRV